MTENFRHFIIMPESQKRQIAYKVRIKDILDGRYVKEEGWQPNYIVTEDNREVSRVNLMGIIVDKQFEFDRVIAIIDDGSGKITIRTFNDINLDNLEIGDILLVIGRPREYNNEKYIMPEILRKIKNKKWIDFRKKELEKELRGVKKEKKVEKEVKEERIESPSEKIFNLIKKLDSGDGVNFDEIINTVNIKEAEKIINNLLSQGEIFQNKPGKLKVLE